MNLSNHFLLAMPGLTGDYFADSLIYLCEHNDQGALGLIVNRPAPVSLLDLLAQLGLNASTTWADVAVFEGGPVACDQALVLHSDDRIFASSTPTGPGICMASALDVMEAVTSDQLPAHFLTALGYAGWGPGQLEQELADNAWLSVAAQPEILFEVTPAERTHRAAAVLGIDMRFMASRAGHA